MRLARALTAHARILVGVCAVTILVVGLPASAQARAHGTTLVVRVNGLPAGVPARATLTGPHLRRRVTAHKLTLRSVRPGRYRLSLKTVRTQTRVRGRLVRVLAMPGSSVSVTVRRGRTARLSASYASVTRSRLRASTVQIDGAGVLKVTGSPSGAQAVVLARGTQPPRIGAALVVEPSRGAPDGVLGTVTDASRLGDGSLSLKIKPGTLQDAYSEFDAKLSGNLGDLVASGRSSGRARPRVTVPVLDAQFGCDRPSIVPSLVHQIDLSKMHVDAEVEIPSSANGFQGPGVHFLLVGTPSVTLGAQFAGSATCTATATAIAVPFPATPGLVLKIGPKYEVKADGSVKATFTWSPTIAFGFDRFRGGPNQEAKSFHNGGSTNFAGDANLRVSLALRADLSLAGRVGVTGTMGPVVNGHASAQTNPPGRCLTADGDFEASLSAFADAFFKDWTFNLGNFAFGHVQLYRACSASAASGDTGGGAGGSGGNSSDGGSGAGSGGAGCPAGGPSAAGGWAVPVSDRLWTGAVSPCGSTVICANKFDSGSGRGWGELTVIGGDGSPRWSTSSSPDDPYLPNCGAVFFDSAENLYVDGYATSDLSHQLLSYNAQGQLRWSAPSPGGALIADPASIGSVVALATLGTDGNAYFGAAQAGICQLCQAGIEGFAPATGASTVTPIGVSSFLPGRNGPAASLGAYPGHLVLGAAGPSSAGETRYYDYGGRELSHYEPDDVPDQLSPSTVSSYAGLDGLMTQGYDAIQGQCGQGAATVNAAWEVHQTTPSGIRWVYVTPTRVETCDGFPAGPMRVLTLPSGAAVVDADTSTGSVGLDLTGFNATGQPTWSADLRDGTAGNAQSLLGLNVSRSGEVVALVVGGHPCVDDHDFICSFVTLHFFSGTTGAPSRNSIDWEGSSLDVLQGKGNPQARALALGTGELYIDYGDAHLAESVVGVSVPGLQPDLSVGVQHP
jgi:hypothetical protein